MIKVERIATTPEWRRQIAKNLARGRREPLWLLRIRAWFWRRQMFKRYGSWKVPMQYGVYRKLEGHTGVGMLYQFLALARHHTTGAHYVVYIPLRVEPEWSGTIRPCVLERDLFEKKFEFVGEALPKPCPICQQTDEVFGFDSADPEAAGAFHCRRCGGVF